MCVCVTRAEGLPSGHLDFQKRIQNRWTNVMGRGNEVKSRRQVYLRCERRCLKDHSHGRLGGCLGEKHLYPFTKTNNPNEHGLPR